MDRASYFSVTEINNIVKETVEFNSLLRQVCVRGEVSGLASYKKKRHTYFTLKDSVTQLGCVHWNLTDIKDGDKVEVFGRVQVWSKSGQYKFVATRVSRVGEGDEKEKLEKLKKELERKGYFLEGNKKPIPSVIKTVALLTSAGGAAVGDVAKTLENRGSIANVVVYDVRVQGQDAASTISKTVEQINHSATSVDVIVITRGGGSKEDLSAFNKEACYEAIHNSAIPIIAAIGHERDLSISEMCADLHCITPTDAATEIAMRSSREMYFERGVASFYGIDQKFKRHISLLEKQLFMIKLVSPLERVMLRENVLKELRSKMEHRVISYFNKKEFELSGLELKIESASPFNILDRGYALVYKGDQVIDVQSVASGDTLDILLKGGSVRAEVKGVQYE